MQKKKNIVILIMAIFLFTGCATYYQKSLLFNEQFAQGNLSDAKEFLDKHKKASKKKDRLLYFFDAGVVEQMLGNYEHSNQYFEQAYTYIEDQKRNFTDDLIGFVANPMLRPYRAEDYEKVVLHYYKAINYIQLHQLDNALIEVRRINIKLNELNDKYSDKKNRYKKDAFALNLMGIIYEAKGDINNAFIAYRNAYEAYQEVYESSFKTSVPEQLKKDLIRTSGQLGFKQELNGYEEAFGLSYKVQEKKGELILFWLNGLGPVKGEFSLNLSSLGEDDGVFTFADETGGFSIPVASTSAKQGSDFSDVNLIRLAIPKFNKRPPVYTSAQLLNVKENQTEMQQLEISQNIEQIAFSSLQDRMFRELGAAVARLAIKQASEAALRKQNEDLGALLSVVNAFSEKADTRNWQTLPNSIHYVRMPLDTGIHELKLLTEVAGDRRDTVSIQVEIKGVETAFRTYHSLESYPPIP